MTPTRIEAASAEQQREMLEEAFKVIHCANDPTAYRELWTRFRRFLDAEAWMDAAMCLVPEGKGFCIMGNAAKVGKHVGVGETPALALAQACLKARENGDA